ncbi:MAG: hypothetical protein V4773_13095 [Verrucomicrobiota bacterium]
MAFQVALGIVLAFSSVERAIDVDRAMPATVKIAVVIPDGASNETWLRAAIDARLMTLLERTGAPVAVHSESMKAAQAAAQLDARQCDAVILLGRARPDVLREVNILTFAASLGPDYGFRPAYLVMPGADFVRKGRLIGAFPQAMRTLGNAVIEERAERP